MSDELQIVSGSERWDGTAVRVDVLLNGDTRKVRLCASAIASAATNDPARTVSRNLDALRPAIMIASRGPGTHIRDVY